MPAASEARTSAIRFAYGWPARASCCAFFIFEAATSSIAFVIWRMFLTDLMRRRMSRVLGIVGAAYQGPVSGDSGGEGRLPLVARRLELGLKVLVEGGLRADLREERILAGREEILEGGRRL